MLCVLLPLLAWFSFFAGSTPAPHLAELLPCVACMVGESMNVSARRVHGVRGRWRTSPETMRHILLSSFVGCVYAYMLRYRAWSRQHRCLLAGDGVSTDDFCFPASFDCPRGTLGGFCAPNAPVFVRQCLLCACRPAWVLLCSDNEQRQSPPSAFSHSNKVCVGKVLSRPARTCKV